MSIRFIEQRDMSTCTSLLLLLLVCCACLALGADVNEQCGRRKQARIIGGWQPRVNEYPMQAGLVRGKPSWVFCSATIVSKRLLLTAAHCVQKHAAAGVKVLVGGHDYRDRAPTKLSKLYSVDRFVLHPQFNGVGGNDLALVRTQKEIEFNAAVGPVCLPTG